MSRIGYELDRIDYDPPQFWLYRCRRGRRIASFGPFATEELSRAELAMQERLDEDDLRRAKEGPYN